MYVVRDRRRQDEDGRTDEEKNVHVWRVVLSYDSYLLTTEKTFLLFRRVSCSLPLSLLLARLPLCVCPLLFSPAREREQALLACSRARAFADSLSVCVSPPPTTSLLLLHIASSSHHHPCFLLFRCRIFCLQHFYT